MYQNKNLDINLKKINVSTNLMSTIILYMIDFESPLLSKYKKENLDDKNDKDIYSIISNEIQDNKEDELEHKLQINTQINYTKLFEDILNDFSFYLGELIFNYQSNDFILSLNLNNIKAIKEKKDEKINLCSSIESLNLCVDSPKINMMNKKVLYNNEKIMINFDFSDEMFKGIFKSIYFDMTIEIIFEIWDNTKFILNQINWDIILCKMEYKFDDFVIILDQFKYNISKILFVNFKENGEKVNALFFKIFDFVMLNKNGNKIIYEKELNFEYYFTSSTENDIIIKFNNPNIEISQNDISLLLSLIKFPKKKEEEKIIRNATFIPNKTSIKTKTENKIALSEIDKDNTNNNLSTNSLNRLSLTGDINQKKKKFSMTLNIIITKLNLSFCLNHKEKIEEIVIESSNIKLKNILYENLFNNEPKNELSYSILLGKINFAFFYSKDNSINILSKRAICQESNNIKENAIKDEKEIKDKNKNINQVEIVSNQNGLKININQNAINI